MDWPPKQSNSCKDNNNDTPTGGNDKAAAGDRSNELTNTSCAEEACWNPGGQWGMPGGLKR